MLLHVELVQNSAQLLSDYRGLAAEPKIWCNEQIMMFVWPIRPPRSVPFTKLTMRSPSKGQIAYPSVSNVIYLFECRHCEGRYVGKTAKRLGERIKQHVPRHLTDTALGAEPAKEEGPPTQET